MLVHSRFGWKSRCDARLRAPYSELTLLSFLLMLQRKISARSDRVKAVDFHPTEPWILAALYNGNVHVWNYENKNMVKSFEVSELPGASLLIH